MAQPGDAEQGAQLQGNDGVNWDLGLVSENTFAGHAFDDQTQWGESTYPGMFRPTFASQFGGAINSSQAHVGVAGVPTAASLPSPYQYGLAPFTNTSLANNSYSWNNNNNLTHFTSGSSNSLAQDAPSSIYSPQLHTTSPMPQFFDSAQLAREQASFIYQTPTKQDTSNSTIHQTVQSSLVPSHNNDAHNSATGLSDIPDLSSDESDENDNASFSTPKNTARRSRRKSEDEDYEPEEAVDEDYEPEEAADEDYEPEAIDEVADDIESVPMTPKTPKTPRSNRKECLPVKMPPMSLLSKDAKKWIEAFVLSALPDTPKISPVSQEPLDHHAMTDEVLIHGIVIVSAKLVEDMNRGAELERKLKGQGERRTKVLTSNVYNPITEKIVREEKWDLDDMRYCIAEGMKRVEMSRRKTANFERRLEEKAVRDAKLGKTSGQNTKKGAAGRSRGDSSAKKPTSVSDAMLPPITPSKKRGSQSILTSPVAKKMRTPKTPTPRKPAPRTPGAPVDAFAGMALQSASKRKTARPSSHKKTPSGRKAKVIDDDSDEYVD